MSALPLAGRRILVTRAIHQSGKLSQGLRDLGAHPVEVPVLEIRQPESFAGIDDALANLSRYDWLVLTSANAVHALVERGAQMGTGWVQPTGLSVAAIGESTASAARHAGLNVSFVPESYVAESLVEGLVSKTPRSRVLILRAAVARDVLPDALRACGAEVDVVEAYRNGMPESAPALLRSALSAGIDAVTFTSSSSVKHLAQAAQAAGIGWPFDEAVAVSIGPITSQTLRESGWEPAIEANPSDICGLLSATAALFRVDNSGKR